ncbi:TRAP transporter small permease [Ectothiorhodospiraceae bacterium WFHF3C12]|nr:TRAP transporter small permease [Ectothiorhodospiraceae bacterium WFHF3C12]
MRRALDALYAGCAVLAAISLAAIAVLVLAQSVGRLIGVVVPSANELAGFCVAASAFLALAPTLRQGVHIRVTLVIGQLPDRVRHWLEIWCLAAALAMACFAAYWTVDLVVGSYRFGDVSPGLLVIPLWMPQSAMALGLVVFAICLLDILIELLRGRTPVYRRAEEPGDSQA